MASLSNWCGKEHNITKVYHLLNTSGCASTSLIKESNNLNIPRRLKFLQLVQDIKLRQHLAIEEARHHKGNWVPRFPDFGIDDGLVPDLNLAPNTFHLSCARAVQEGPERFLVTEVLIAVVF